jgi:hypothetical protein
MEATSARLAEGWQQATTILIRVDPWKATSFGHVYVYLFLQGIRRGRLIRLTDEDTMTPEETAAVAYRFLDPNRIPRKSRPADAVGVEAEGHPPSLVFRQKRSQTEAGTGGFRGWIMAVRARPSA